MLVHNPLMHVYFVSEDFLDAYQAMRSSIGIHDADKVKKCLKYR